MHNSLAVLLYDSLYNYEQRNGKMSCFCENSDFWALPVTSSHFTLKFLFFISMGMVTVYTHTEFQRPVHLGFLGITYYVYLRSASLVTLTFINLRFFLPILRQVLFIDTTYKFGVYIFKNHEVIAKNSLWHLALNSPIGNGYHGNTQNWMNEYFS